MSCHRQKNGGQHQNVFHMQNLEDPLVFPGEYDFCSQNDQEHSSEDASRSKPCQGVEGQRRATVEKIHLQIKHSGRKKQRGQKYCVFHFFQPPCDPGRSFLFLSGTLFEQRKTCHKTQELLYHDQCTPVVQDSRVGDDPVQLKHTGVGNAFCKEKGQSPRSQSRPQPPIPFHKGKFAAAEEKRKNQYGGNKNRHGRKIISPDSSSASKAAFAQLSGLWHVLRYEG